MSFTRAVSSELHSDGDGILNGAALPNTTTKTSGIFYHAGIMSGLEIVIEASASITIAANKSLSIDLYHADKETDTFTKAASIISVSGEKTIAANTEIVRFVPCSTVKRCMKLSFTADSDLSAGKVDAFLVRKG